MKVYHEGRLLFTWPVSTAKPGKITPDRHLRARIPVPKPPLKPLQQRADALRDLL
jgi:hypothetical protein